MDTTRHESPKAKRRSRRFRGGVSAYGVLRKCNFALSELNIFSGFVRRVARRLPYADQFRAVGAGEMPGYDFLKAVRIFGESLHFTGIRSGRDIESFLRCPNQGYGVGTQGQHQKVFEVAGAQRRGPVGKNRPKGIIGRGVFSIVSGALSPDGAKLVSAGQAKRRPVYSEKEFSTLKECNRKEVA